MTGTLELKKPLYIQVEGGSVSSSRQILINKKRDLVIVTHITAGSTKKCSSTCVYSSRADVCTKCKGYYLEGKSLKDKKKVRIAAVYYKVLAPEELALHLL